MFLLYKQRFIYQIGITHFADGCDYDNTPAEEFRFSAITQQDFPVRPKSDYGSV